MAIKMNKPNGQFHPSINRDADDFNRIINQIGDMAYISNQVLEDVAEEITYELENRAPEPVDKSQDPEDEESRRSIAIRENYVIDSQEDKQI